MKDRTGRKKSIFYHLFFIFCLLSITTPGMGLIVTEVMYHPADGQEELEFIELYNNRAVFEDLSGYAFTNGIQYTFEPGTILEAKKYLVVTRNPVAFAAAYPAIALSSIYGPFSGRLANDGERIELSDNAGQILISFRYDEESPWPVSPDGTGHSLVLYRSSGDPEEASTWAPSSMIGGTPGEPDEIQTASTANPSLTVLVSLGQPGRYFKGYSEPSPDSAGWATTDWTEIDFQDNPIRTNWIEGPSGYGYSSEADELQYIGTETNDMSGNYMSIYARFPFTLSYSQIASFSQLQAEVHYDDDYVLYLNGTRVAASDGISGNPPTYNQSGGSATDPSPALVDLTNRLNLLVHGTNVLAMQVHNASLSGSSDCFASPILRAIVGNVGGGDDSRARVLINELLVNSDVDSGFDWIELYNPGPDSIDLSNVYLSDDRSDLLKCKLPDGVVLDADDFWTVNEGTGPNDFNFGLDSTGETVYVTAATSDQVPIRVLDAVRFGAMEPEVTFGRFPDGSKTLNILSEDTLAGPNAQPWVGDIVINEIMYHHAIRDERYEYVELYNRGDSTISLDGWAFTDGIDYTFASGTQIQPDSYLVVAKDPDLLASVYENLIVGTNLVGPYTGSLSDHSERIRLSYPLEHTDPDSGDIDVSMVTADEVTYYDGGRWPSWADGQGASLELRDPRSDNDTPDAWADSDESAKSTWQPFTYTIESTDSRYTHDQVSVFDVLLLNRGEVLLDDLSVTMGRGNILSNSGFESAEANWRRLGNHVRSFATTDDSRSGWRSLHLISTGHGDPGANRVNQSISSGTANRVTFSGWAKWLRGSRFLLLRLSRELSPVQPPRPAHAFELEMPLDLGTPGLQNTAFVTNRGPDILDVQHAPVLPTSGEAITVTARVKDNDGVMSVLLHYRSEGDSRFTSTLMTDNGSGNDEVAGDGIYTAAIPGATGGTMRAFYIEATDGLAITRFPTRLQSTAEVPERTCLVRVGDTQLTTQFPTYRIWLSDDVVRTFRSRPNLSNELLDCTFVYNDTDVFYNARLRFRGSPFIRSGSGQNPLGREAYRITFNPDQKFGDREEINIDTGEGSNRGILQERASYWFYKQMGLQHSTQEFVRPIINGNSHSAFEDVRKIDGDYIDKWFPFDNEGYIHKIDDYFEYSVNGAQHSNLDEGLKYDSRHPLLKETYRWGFEKRSHRENDEWQHLFDLAVALNTSSSSTRYEQAIEEVIHPGHFAKVLAIRHALGDWDSYGYTRGKNNYFYYALPEGKWYLLPWDIDFTLGSGNGASTNLFSVTSSEFPEVKQFLDYPKYKQMYLDAFEELVNGPWQTSYGTSDSPTAFDQFLDDAADALIADGAGDGRRDGIKQFVRNRRNYILTQIPTGR